MVVGSWKLGVGPKGRWKLGVFSVVTLLALPGLVQAQQTAAAPTETKVSVSGYVQPRYDRYTEFGETTDRVFLRRAIVAVQADLAGPWEAELQLDAGPAASNGARLLVKDAVVRYTGWASRGLTIAIGNQKVPFSQSNLQSASRRSLVERPFTGDSEFGSPGRSITLAADGWHRRKTIHWTAALGSTHHSPDPAAIGLEGITRSDDDWFQGRTLAGRVEFHPFAQIPRAQGDLERGPVRFVLAAAAYRWNNDDDVPAPDGSAVDPRHVTGLELSGGLRGAGASIDVEYERIASRAEDPLVSSGLYVAGEADLDKASIEAGYMLWRNHLEATGALDAIDTEAYATPWRRVSIGMNWYVHGHALKFSVTHRESFNDQGVRNVRSRATYVQSHFAF